MLLLVFHKHTQWPGPGRTEKNVVGFPMLPVYAAKAGGFFFIVFGVIALMGGLLAINPVWKFGPYDPTKVTAGSQPDWYMGWPDGALRIMPGWETHVWGHTISWNVFLPIIVLPGLDVHDPAACCRSSRPGSPATSASTTCSSDHATYPTRTATMVALMTFYGLLWAAGGNDIIAITFSLSINQITYFMRVAVFVRPGGGLPDHPSLVHLPAALGPGEAAARLRVRRSSCGRPRAATPSATCPSRRTAPTSSPPATATPTHCPKGPDHNGVAAPAAAPPAAYATAFTTSSTPTTSRSRPLTSSKSWTRANTSSIHADPPEASGGSASGWAGTAASGTHLGRLRRVALRGPGAGAELA